MQTTFEDIAEMADRDVQRTLQEVPVTDAVLALKSASEKVKKKIYSNVSKRVERMIQKEIVRMGPVSGVDVEDVQQGIMDVALRLEEAGEITRYVVDP